MAIVASPRLSGKTFRYGAATARLAAGKASRVILPFAVHPGDRFVLWVRVSTWQQSKNRQQAKRKLAAYAKRLRVAVEEHGGIVVEVYMRVCSGQYLWLTSEIADAALAAEGHGATLLAVTTDRFVRSNRFKAGHGKRQNAQASDAELVDLRFATFGVPLMTLLHPDSPPGQCGGLQKAIGKAASPRRQGRPPASGRLKQRKDKCKPLVLELRREGFSWRRIANGVRLRLGYQLPHKTAREWWLEEMQV